MFDMPLAVSSQDRMDGLRGVVPAMPAWLPVSCSDYNSNDGTFPKPRFALLTRTHAIPLILLAITHYLTIDRILQ